MEAETVVHGRYVVVHVVAGQCRLERSKGLEGLRKLARDLLGGIRDLKTFQLSSCTNARSYLGRVIEQPREKSLELRFVVLQFGEMRVHIRKWYDRRHVVVRGLRLAGVVELESLHDLRV